MNPFMLAVFATQAEVATGGGGGGGGGGTTTDGPVVSNVTVATQYAGLCEFSFADPAAILISWDLSSLPGTDYRVRVLRDGVLRGTVTSGASSWLERISGYVENGPVRAVTFGWVFTVQVQRIADGVITSSASADPWMQQYGTCSSPRGGVGDGAGGVV